MGKMTMRIGWNASARTGREQQVVEYPTDQPIEFDGVDLMLSIDANGALTINCPSGIAYPAVRPMGGNRIMVFASSQEPSAPRPASPRPSDLLRAERGYHAQNNDGGTGNEATAALVAEQEEGAGYTFAEGAARRRSKKRPSKKEDT
jgi:hypothetical protein